MPKTYTVLTPDDVIVGEADDLQAAVAIMSSYYLRLLHDYLVTVEGSEIVAIIGAAPIDVPPAQIPLQMTVANVSPNVFNFVLSGIDKKAHLDFGDGQAKDVSKDGVVTPHTFATDGSYHVVASEGSRTAEAWITITAPPPEPEEPPA